MALTERRLVADDHPFRCARALDMPQFLRLTLPIVVLSFGVWPTVHASASSSDSHALHIFFVDVEGGQATLFVTPAKQALLIDTGWPGSDGRDADRIVAVVKAAGISKRTVIDHGDNRETTDGTTLQAWQAYQQLLAEKKFKRLTVKPGDSLSIRAVDTVVISCDGAVIDRPLAQAGQKNPACTSAGQYPPDQTENGRSLGTLISFGKLKILDLGDLTGDKETELVCPTNKLGLMDIYIVSHHGWYQSGSPAFVNTIAPRIAIMDNGAKKGGNPSAWDIIEKSPRLLDLWQLHFSDQGGAAHNVAPDFIANPQGPDDGNYLELTAWRDGNFEVFNSRTNKAKHYRPR
jgi:beta-lactamase superfamily II metal-dependent hydrolase